MNSTNKVARLRGGRSVLMASAAVGLMAGLIGAGPALAAPTAAAPATTAEAPDQLAIGEVIVTARRKAEQIQEVPVAVTAFGADALRAQSINRVEDLRQHAAGLSIAPSGFGGNVPSFTIRSQLQFEPLLTQDPSVSVYFADVLQARAHGLNSALYDLDNVQVLKGPQGTLFGRNSTGGAILITPRAPQPEFGGEANLTLGDYNRREFEGALNVPLASWAQLRISGDTARRDGFTKNLWNGEDMDDQHADNWRVSLRLRPIDSLVNTTVINGFVATENGTGFRLRYVNPTAVLNTLGAQGPSVLAQLQQTIATLNASDFHTVSNSIEPDATRVNTFNISNVTEWAFADNLTLKNIYGYRRVDSDVQFSYSGSPVFVNGAFGSVPLYNSREIQDSHQNSEELQLLGKSFDQKLDWIVGAYGEIEKGLEWQRSFLLTQDRLYLAEVKNTTAALFAQGTYQLPWVEGLSATGGLRYTWDGRHMTAHTQFITGACRMLTADVGGVPLNPCDRPVKADFSKLTWNFSLNWQFEANKLAYVSASRGYRAGGFNFRGVLPSEFIPFRPETVTNYELGLKADWRLGPTLLRTNLAAYYQDYQDIQRTVSVSTPQSAIVTTVMNAASAHIPGFEAEVTWLPLENLEIGANWAWSEPKYDNFTVGTPPRVVDNSASHFALAPKNTVSAYARYTWPLQNDLGRIVAQADIYHQSTIQFNDINDPVSHGDPYTLGNLRVAWEEIMGRPMDLAVMVRNVTDTEYLVGGVTVYPSIGYSVGSLGAPRNFAVQLSYRF